MKNSFSLNMLSLFSTLLLVLHLATPAFSRCTRTNDNSFVLTTYNTTSPSLNNTSLSYVQENLPVIPDSPIGPSLLPLFKPDNTIWRTKPNDPTKLEQGYLRKNLGGALTGWLFVFGGKPPAGSITNIDIGCDYYGRHFLIFGGYERWRACKVDGGWSLIAGATKWNPECTEEVRWLWVDYVRPV